ncbi:hypothetical protein ACOCJ7_18095 [Knoellia sp. CPCC 206453]|uniref:hypothetical protein n=1 Tax=Knoellia pratensis TaxID=3404796 RepID=UPI003617FE9B
MKVQRWEPTDELFHDGEVAVLIRGSVVRLSALSTAIYTLTEQPLDVDELSRELQSRFGVPPDSSTLQKTKDAVAELIRFGILHRV